MSDEAELKRLRAMHSGWVPRHLLEPKKAETPKAEPKPPKVKPPKPAPHDVKDGDGNGE
jgi:hypothetical protein